MATTDNSIMGKLDKEQAESNVSPNVLVNFSAND